MKVLIVGNGSIGRRHGEVLRELGHDVAVVTRREEPGIEKFGTLASGIEGWSPEYLVVASATNEHLTDLKIIGDCGYRGKVLIEKPLFGSNSEIPEIAPDDKFVGYNLRFHPVVRQLQSRLRDEDVIAVQVYAGQYLPDWRPNRDYRESYSAKKSAAGGVLRDLSHELDYLMWILGGWKRLTANGGKLGDLEIDSEDIVTLLVEFERCPAAVVQLNYLDSELRREVIAVTNRGTVKADLVANSIEYKGEIDQYETSRNQTYLDQHRAILSNAHRDNCTFEQGLEVVSMIDAIERSMDENRWITNE